MSELTTRLRTECSVYDVELCKEAADRIAFLQKEISEANDENAGYIDKLFDQKRRIEELEAENERLRGGYKELRELIDRELQMCNGTFEPDLEEIEAIIAAALNKLEEWMMGYPVGRDDD